MGSMAQLAQMWVDHTCLSIIPAWRCFAAAMMLMPAGPAEGAGLPDEVVARRGSCGDGPHPAWPAGPLRVGGCGGYGPGRVVGGAG